MDQWKRMESPEIDLHYFLGSVLTLKIIFIEV